MSFLIVCKHLIHGESNDWREIKSPPSQAPGWLCPDCDATSAALNSGTVTAEGLNAFISNLEPLAPESVAKIRAGRAFH